MRKRGLRRLLGAATVTLLALYAWPMWSAFQLRQALRSGDAARLEPRVDWPVLRANLRTTVRSNLAASDGGWFRRQAVRTLGPIMADRAIESLVTPERLARFIRSGLQTSAPPNNQAKAASGQSPANSTASDNVEAEDQAAADPMAPRRMRYAFYDSPSRFRVEVADTTNPSRRLVSILERRGTAWLLTNVFYETAN